MKKIQVHKAVMGLRTGTQNLLEKHLSGESMSYRQIVAIFLPVLVDQAFLTLMNMANTMMISGSGVAAISAVNMVESINSLLLNVFIAMATGGTVVVAQYKGSGNDKMLSKAVGNTVSAVAIFALSMSLLMIVFHQPLLRLLFGNAQPEVLANARIYLIGSATSYTCFAVMEAVCGAFRGMGQTRLSLALSLIMNLSYVLFNLLFINTLRLGVFGLSISQNSARLIGAVCAIIFLARLQIIPYFKLKNLFYLNLTMLKKVFYVGLPFAAEQIFFNGGKLLTQTYLVALGTNAMAETAICNSISGMIQVPGNALCLTVVTVVGQCIGRRDIKDARKFIRSFTVLACFSFVLLGMIIMPFLRPLVQLYQPPAVSVPIIVRLTMMTYVSMVLAWAFSFVFPNSLRAAGDSRYTFIVSLITMWTVRVVLGYVLGISLGLGVFGIFLAMNIEWYVRGFIFYLRLRGKKWYEHHLID